MKESHLFFIAAIIFAILTVYFFNNGGRISNGISIFMLFGCFLTLCAGADSAQLKNRNK